MRRFDGRRRCCILTSLVLRKWNGNFFLKWWEQKKT